MLRDNFHDAYNPWGLAVGVVEERKIAFGHGSEVVARCEASVRHIDLQLLCFMSLVSCYLPGYARIPDSVVSKSIHRDAQHDPPSHGSGAVLALKSSIEKRIS